MCVGIKLNTNINNNFGLEIKRSTCLKHIWLHDTLILKINFELYDCSKIPQWWHPDKRKMNLDVYICHNMFLKYYKLVYTVQKWVSMVD